MREFQKEYEAYMKKVTDGFINMQYETVTQDESDNKMSPMMVIDWNSGLLWKAIRQEEMCRDGNLMEENRKYNSEIALKYLQSNTMTYSEWYNKFKL